ncbi:calcium-binding protein [Microvirga roseola]|uniref:calcium-binding protein n=1 Tax=Microvirga roseola TaxID=2883126 RepID=UPI001E52B756|nr:calcium-binding protein [Microvirga roseola]
MAREPYMLDLDDQAGLQADDIASPASAALAPWEGTEEGDTYEGADDADDVLDGKGGNDDLSGRGGNDLLSGREGDDTLYGGDHLDTLSGGAGADLLDGGNGFDFASYAAATGGVTVSLLNPALNGGEAVGDTYDSIQGIIGSTFNDVLVGSHDVNHLIGGGGHDTLDGRAGTDTLEEGTGNDVYIDPLEDTIIDISGIDTVRNEPKLCSRRSCRKPLPLGSKCDDRFGALAQRAEQHHCRQRRGQQSRRQGRL